LVLFVEIDDACQLDVIRIMAAYPRLFDTVKGRSGGDPFVIALARIKCPPMTLVTEESPGKQSAKPSITARRNLSC
jgi:hypothetical protein